MILGIDVSYYQQKVDWPALKESGVEFAIIKCTSGLGKDTMFLEHIKGASDAGMITGCYHWCDPIQDDVRQAANVLAVIKDQPVDMIALDVEQWWSDWNAWYQSITKKISNADVPRMNAQRISDNGLNVARYISEHDPLKRPILIYTAKWFTDSYSPQITSWVPNYHLWTAQYPYAAGGIKLAWSEFKTKYWPMAKSPILPRGLTEWKIWQFSGDKFQLPGIYGDKGGTRLSSCDINQFNGDLADLFAFVGKTPPAPPPAEPIPLEVSAKEQLARLWAAHPELHP